MKVLYFTCSYRVRSAYRMRVWSGTNRKTSPCNLGIIIWMGGWGSPGAKGWRIYSCPCVWSLERRLRLCVHLIGLQRGKTCHPVHVECMSELWDWLL